MRRSVTTLMVSFVLAVALAGAGPAEATPCTPGSTSIDGEEPCTPCPSGTFAPGPGATSCLECPVGAYAPGEGAASCVTCDPGTYADVPGATTCTPCAAGTVVDFAGAVACQACGPGYFADQPGMTQCLLCSAGTVATQSASASCEPCAAGTYSEVLGGTECLVCAPGTASAIVGANSSSTCTPCAAGTFASDAGSAACTNCPRNAYAPSAGRTQCLVCGCDDEIPCTRDTCDRVSAACSAPAVPACQPVEIGFQGSVTYVDAPLASTTPLGDTVEGHLLYDPEAPDASPTDPIYGDFPGAVQSFELTIGVGPAIAASSPSGRVRVEDDGILGDVLTFEAYASDGLTATPVEALPGSSATSIRLRLADASGDAITSDALPSVAPPFSRFASHGAGIEIYSGNVASYYADAGDIVETPEADASLAVGTAIAALGALALRRTH